MVQQRNNNDAKKWKRRFIVIAWIVIAILLIFYYPNMESKYQSPKIAGDGPTTQTAMINIELFLKRQYLKDPDSYESIGWGPSGIYMKENNTYFMMHKYRARNSFGGYVVENPMFILNANGDVIDVQTDINDVVNDGY